MSVNPGSRRDKDRTIQGTTRRPGDPAQFSRTLPIYSVVVDHVDCRPLSRGSVPRSKATATKTDRSLTGKEWRASFDRSSDRIPTRHPQTSYARENTCFVAEWVSATKCVASCDAAVNQPVKPSPRAITGQANGKVNRTVNSALAVRGMQPVLGHTQYGRNAEGRRPLGAHAFAMLCMPRIVERQITM